MSLNQGDIRDSTLHSLKPLDDGRTEEALKSTKIWEKLSRWVACVCVVTFDLELGQAIEVC